MTKLNKWHDLCIFLFLFFLSTGRIFRHQIKSTQRASERGGREGDLDDKSTVCMCAAGCIKTDCIWVLLRSLFCHSTLSICRHVSPFSFPPSSPPPSCAVGSEFGPKTRYYVVFVIALVTADWREQEVREGRREMGCWHGKGIVEVFYKPAVVLNRMCCRSTFCLSGK